MRLREWANRQLKIWETRRAIKETNLQIKTWQGVTRELETAEYDTGTLDRFDSNIPEFLGKSISALQKREANLWGFKGNPAEWMGSQEMIASGKIEWNGEQRPRHTLADIYLNDLRGQLQYSLNQLNFGHQTPEETRVVIKAEIDSFCGRCLKYRQELEGQGATYRFTNFNTIEKLKEIVQKRVVPTIKTTRSVLYSQWLRLVHLPLFQKARPHFYKGRPGVARPTRR